MFQILHETCVLVAWLYPTLCDPMTGARQTPLSMEFSRQEYWEGNGNPLQYSCRENPMDRGAWWSTVHGVTKSQTQLTFSTYSKRYEIRSYSGFDLHFLDD